VIGSQIVFINFCIFTTICGPIKIVHISSISIYVQIRCVSECSPKLCIIIGLVCLLHYYTKFPFILVYSQHAWI
jgi:hypothetical protein